MELYKVMLVDIENWEENELANERIFIEKFELKWD